MRLAILSDVHSNLHALDAVLKHVDHLEVESVLCAGDIVGYGAYPNECSAILRERASISVLGNHDRAVIQNDTAGMNPYAARAAAWTAKAINASSRAFLEGLGCESRSTLGGKSIAMFHGSPRSTDEYVYEYAVSEELVRSTGAEVMILGHTHVPFVRRFESGLFVNPGAVGQPRDGDWMASFAVLDTDSAECSVLRVPYDVAAAAESIRHAGLPESLAARLLRGE